MSHPKLKPQNKHLNPRNFRICVPKHCKLLGYPIHEDDEWKKYIDSLYREGSRRRRNSRSWQSREIVPCPCGHGWVLRGRMAVRHATRVHGKVYQQFLKAPGVSAVDVGFALKERGGRFENTLALRLHLTEKMLPYLLLESQRQSFSSPLYSLMGRSLKRPDPAPPGDAAVDAVDPAIHCWHLESELSDSERHRLIDQVRKDLPCSWKKDRKAFKKGLYNCYPIHCVHPRDLSYCVQPGWNPCPDSQEPPRGRLCICGVPIDVIGKAYHPATDFNGTGSGSRDGVFANPLKQSVELSNEELLLTGRHRINPLVGGASIGSRTGQAGTLATIVWDRTDGEPCILSNWHVLAGNLSATFGQPCYQPAQFDGGTTADIAGYLKRWHIGMSGDVAIAELSRDRNYAVGEVLGMWHPVSGTKQPELNLPIRKWGRTTGFTRGFIDGIHLAVNLDYGGGVIRNFTEQFHIAPKYKGETVSHVGDSGSLVITALDPNGLENAREDCQWKLKQLEVDLVKICENDTLIENLRHHLSEYEPDPHCPPKVHKVLRSLCQPDQQPNPQSGDSNCDEVLFDLLSLDEKQGSVLIEYLEDAGLSFNTGRAKENDRRARRRSRIYLAVGMIFAGDTPGSPLGEFALASDITVLEKELQFSLRPVFEPRSSFRTLRSERFEAGSRAASSQRRFAPGAPAGDSRSGGPQPDFEPLQPEPGG